MSRARHFSKANLLWTNVAYCDQWSKVMAVYDERENLRAVVREVDVNESNVLLIGDDTQMLYIINGIELGSTGKNLKACFEIYCRLQHVETPSYIPSYRRFEPIKLFRVFIHTRVGARRTGGFRVTTEDIGEKITRALKRYEEIINAGVETINCVEWFDNSYDDKYRDPDTIMGMDGCLIMHHVGGGVYCDDDGDNWEFT